MLGQPVVQAEHLVAYRADVTLVIVIVIIIIVVIVIIIIIIIIVIMFMTFGGILGRCSSDGGIC